jgi:sulfur-oxidizing protein SoxB
MSLSRREFLQILGAAGVAGLGAGGPGAAESATADDYYAFPPFGNLRLLHFTDAHAQLLPLYFREADINIGVAEAAGRPPHLVGDAFLRRFGFARGSREAYAFTHLDFGEAARRFGRVGGFAHLATLVKRLRAERPERTLLLDGGDTWQGSATSLFSKGQDMVEACKLLGVDIMTGHWEFTYGAERVQEIVEKELKGHIEFLAQNVNETTWGELIFKPYVIRNLGGVPVAVIGQAFPYTPIANPRHLVPDWSFGIKEQHLQKMVDETRAKGAQVVAVLSHNGADVDLKMAGRVRGIDVILGGHTHDAVPEPAIVRNGGGRTLVINSGSNAKFLSVLDLEVQGGAVSGYRYKLLPVFSNLLSPDPAMTRFIEGVRTPYQARLGEKLAVTESLLYRRGNFNGTFDQVIVQALLEVLGADVAFSPGFRWGTTLLPGDPITMWQIIDLTAITYPNVTLNVLTGQEIVDVLEDVADNLFNEDPYSQMGGDMARVGGLSYAIDPTQRIGRRLSEVSIRGKPLDPHKRYRVAGWASVQPPRESGRPVWEIVAEYLRAKKVVRIERPNVPRIKGVAGNPGVAL